MQRNEICGMVMRFFVRCVIDCYFKCGFMGVAVVVTGTKVDRLLQKTSSVVRMGILCQGSSSREARRQEKGGVKVRLFTALVQSVLAGL